MTPTTQRTPCDLAARLLPGKRSKKRAILLDVLRVVMALACRCLCEGCASVLMGSEALCPLCRGQVTNALKVYR